VFGLRWNNSEAVTNQESNDPVLDQVRSARHEISARFEHDPTRLIAYYMELQKEYRNRLLHDPEAEAVGRGKDQPVLALPDSEHGPISESSDLKPQ
jgi:hypothetical protein